MAELDVPGIGAAQAIFGAIDETTREPKIAIIEESVFFIRSA